MAREIKFRMVYQTTGEIIGYTDAYRLLRYGNDELPDYEKAVLQGISFEQYTGLKDKNGKEIYEGDIVCCQPTSPVKFIGVVEFHNGSFGVRIVKGEQFYTAVVLNSIGEVIGNIHENPELLK